MGSLPLPGRIEALAQSDIRRMTIACERRGGINLGQGVCDLPTHPVLREAAVRAVEASRASYTRYDGIPSLRAAIAQRVKAKNGVD